MRIGQGFDVHKLVPGEGLPLGGVWINCDLAVVAHSDGDVLLHAICDALLGALALGDIGHFFPDNDPAFKDINSLELLSRCWDEVKKRGFQLENLDSTVIAQKPKVAPHIDSIRQSIAKVLEVSVEQVSVKATTTEKLGFTGRGEGIAAQASVLISAS